MKQPLCFTIGIEPAFTAPTRYYRRKNSLLVDIGDREHRAIQPTLQQWSGFWRLCDFLDLWNWMPDYGNSAARDGDRWRIDIAFDKFKHIKSQGVSCYPSLEDASRGSYTMDRFSLLLHFAELTLLTTPSRPQHHFGDYSLR